MENFYSKMSLLIKKAYLLGFFFILCPIINGQNMAIVDSLELIYNTKAFKKGNRLFILERLSYNHTDPEKVLKYSEELIELARDLDSINYLFPGFLNRGNAYRMKGDLSKSLESYFQAANIAIENNKNIDLVKVNITDQQLSFERIDEQKFTKSYHGLIRALAQNMIIGVDELFSKVLIAEGVGYKFQVDAKKVILSAGFSHTIDFVIPEDLKVKQETSTKIIISGINKETVGFFASKIREKRPPEPYKGKGIKYEGEKILRKAGKTGR